MSNRILFVCVYPISMLSCLIGKTERRESDTMTACAAQPTAGLVLPVVYPAERSGFYRPAVLLHHSPAVVLEPEGISSTEVPQEHLQAFRAS